MQLQNDDAVARTTNRIRQEFTDMPGLRLTTAQARRLWPVDATTLARAVGGLLDARFLCRTPSGQLMRERRSRPRGAAVTVTPRETRKAVAVGAAASRR